MICKQNRCHVFSQNRLHKGQYQVCTLLGNTSVNRFASGPTGCYLEDMLCLLKVTSFYILSSKVSMTKFASCFIKNHLLERCMKKSRVSCSHSTNIQLAEHKHLCTMLRSFSTVFLALLPSGSMCNISLSNRV